MAFWPLQVATIAVVTESPFRALNPDQTPQEPERLIYHYTNGSGALGIVSSGFVWATHARFLNDSSEIHSSFSYAASLLESKYRTANPDLADGIDQFVNYVRQAGRITPNIYLACFSEAPDLLSQWRGYGGTGGQVALGVNVDDLGQCATSHGWRLERCIYGHDDQYLVMTRLLELVIREFSTTHHDTCDPSRAKALFDMFYSNVLHISPRLKNHAFAEESEWRLISPLIPTAAGPLIRFRPGMNSLIPYTEFSLPRKDGRLRIPHYYVGPGPGKVLAAEALGMLFNVMDVSVDASSISQTPFLP
jgi:hypothetical protein